jgi:hypothetical protein
VRYWAWVAVTLLLVAWVAWCLGEIGEVWGGVLPGPG